MHIPAHASEHPDQRKENTVKETCSYKLKFYHPSGDLFATLEVDNASRAMLRDTLACLKKTLTTGTIAALEDLADGLGAGHTPPVTLKTETAGMPDAEPAPAEDAENEYDDFEDEDGGEEYTDEDDVDVIDPYALLDLGKPVGGFPGSRSVRPESGKDT